MITRLLIAAFCCLLSFASDAETVILDYQSDIQIQKNANLLVTEIISVQSDGTQIRHGIFRDFPVRYESLSGMQKRIGFRVISATLDGEPTPYVVERNDRFQRVKIGDANVYLPPGNYVFKLTYETTEQVGFFEEHDELYWNVTGNGWRFPIRSVTAQVQLPDNSTTQVLKTTAFTGFYGARDQNYQVQKTAQKIIFSSTTPLSVGQGFTIAVAWQKGLVSAPTVLQKTARMIRYYPSILTVFVGFFVVLGYYLYRYKIVNSRRPPLGSIFPRFKPPTGVTPAACRFVKEMGFDKRVLTAAIVNLARKGHLIIEQDGKKFTLRKQDSKEQLSKAEHKLMSELFSRGNPKFALDAENYDYLSVALESYKKELRTEFKDKFFILNLKYYLIGVILSLFTLLIGWLQSNSMVTIGMLVLAVIVMIAPLIYKYSNSDNTIPAWRKWLLQIIILGFFVMILNFSVLDVFNFNFEDMLYIVLSGMLIAINLIFFKRIRRYTEQGRTLVNHVDGFKMFLNATEKERLKMTTAPDRTPDLFERFLPFAIALGVEENWSKQFEKVFLEQNYQPTWYVGDNYSARAFNSNVSRHLTKSLGGAVASTLTPPPGSSSAFGGSGGFGGGGGGFSGGGGGGGGGGGW